MPRSASEACPAAASSKSTVPSQAARQRSPCRFSRRLRRWAVSLPAFIDAEHALDPVYAARIGVDIDEVLISQPDTGEQALEICDMLVRSGAIDIDAEHALDPVYAARIGVDIDEVLISQPDTGEQALEICDMLVRSGAIDCVIVDSVAALVPRAEIEGEMGDTTVGLQARLMSQALRKLAGSLSKSNTTCIFINQLREKIGVMFGNPETTTGGRALKFFSSVRIDIRRIDSIKQNGDVVGNRVRAKVVKNKVAPPFRQAEFDLMYGEGISREGCIVDMAVECGVAKKSGAWYTYGEERLGQGREAAKQTLKENPEAKQTLKENPDLREELENKVREAYEIPVIERPAENESFTPAPKSGKKK